MAHIKDFIAKRIKNFDTFPEMNTKWPNDILLDSRKISGLLIENNVNKKQFVIGIGININQELFSPEIKDKAISLKNFIGYDVDRTDFLIDLLSVYSHNIHLLLGKNHDLIYKLWKNSCNLVGKKVIFIDGSGTQRSGKIIDLCKDGGMKLMVNEEILTFYSGEVTLSK